MNVLWNVKLIRRGKGFSANRSIIFKRFLGFENIYGSKSHLKKKKNDIFEPYFKKIHIFEPYFENG